MIMMVMITVMVMFSIMVVMVSDIDNGNCDDDNNDNGHSVMCHGLKDHLNTCNITQHCWKQHVGKWWIVLEALVFKRRQHHATF